MTFAARCFVMRIADKEHGISATSDTLFQAGSISKPVAAVGALHLTERGRLSLDIEEIGQRQRPQGWEIGILQSWTTIC
jgi:hypothetical protein